MTVLAWAVVNVSVAKIGVLNVLQTRVVPVGIVPVCGKVVRFTDVAGQILLAEVGVTEGGIVPATQTDITFTFVLHAAEA